MGDDDRYAALGLRERKKAITRDGIIRAAETLFESRGFDDVSVAEIADAANISVKTLFTYFRSKDDLVFTDTTLIDALTTAVAERPEGTSPYAVVTTVLRVMLAEDGDGITAFRRGYGDSEGLRNGLLRMWADYEDRLTEALASRNDGAVGPDDRYQAIQLVGMVRTIVSNELVALDPDTPNAAALRWLESH